MKTEPSIASMWVTFAAAQITDPATSVQDAANTADALVKEFLARHDWINEGYGAYWARKDEIGRESNEYNPNRYPRARK